MLKFFSKIRHRLINEGNLKRYLLYAIGEVLLVVIGILIALQINNWNEQQREETKARSFLIKLKEDIASDIEFIMSRDSFFARFESNSEKAIDLFHQAKTVNDILTADSLFFSQWNDLRINKSVYEEMLSTGSIYTLKNKTLQDKLTNYYSFIESHQYYIKEVNETSTNLRNSEHLLPLHYLVSSKSSSNLKNINTDWINNINSPTYLALHKFYSYTQDNSNKYRRIIFKRVLNRSQDLIREIELELH